MAIKNNNNDAQVNKILKGLERTYQKLLVDKKAKNGELVVMRDNKIVTIKP